MKTIYFLLIISLLLFTTSCQTRTKLNLDFEDIKNGLPVNWSVYHRQSGYSVSLDSVNVKSGKYSIALELTGGTINFQALTFTLPDHYDGEKITLSGYIKTENVTDGFAGLWMMTDPDIAFRVMEKNGVTGTIDWRKYEITLDMHPAEAKETVISGILTGKGKMWLDDLQVSIDGKDIEKASLYQPKPFRAEEDKDFDYGSNIVFPKLTEQKIKDLELLGRIWGFLKYHHPEIAKGNYNWDYELFRILPAYLNATDYQQRDRILLGWINKYGRIPTCKTCKITPDSAFIKPDLSWIENDNMNLQLSDLLQKIYTNRNQGFHYYINMYPYLWNPIFTNESAYDTMDIPDAGFRLLALYRYWNMIHYFFPSKYLTDKDWNTVLHEYIPCFIEAKNRLEYELIAVRLLGEICDTHAYLLKGWRETESLKGKREVPIGVSFVENKLAVMKYYPVKAENAGLKTGDIITHIEGKPVEDIVDSMKHYYPASNEAARMEKIARDILRTNKPYLQIEYNSSGKTNKKEIDAEERSKLQHYLPSWEKDTDKCFRFIDKDIGYINLRIITAKDIPVIKQEFINTRGIIIDLRNYPPHIIDVLGSYFVSRITPYARHTRGNPDNPGEFVFIPPFELPKSEEYYPGKLVVIVNEATLSNAEYTAMAFRAGDHTTVIGSTTAGADGNVSEIVLPGGLHTLFSGNGVYYPDGRETQRIGIVPDVEVKPTLKGIRKGRDELLDKAIEIINQE